METKELNGSVPEEQIDNNIVDTTEENVTEGKNEETATVLEGEDVVGVLADEPNDAADVLDVELVEPDSVEDENPADVDYSSLSKHELVETLDRLLKDQPVQSLRKDIDAIKVAFYKHLRQEIEQLKTTFVAEGNKGEDFTPPVDGEEENLKALISRYRKLRDEFIADSEKEKEENYKRKLKIIEDLKELVNSNETLNQTFASFRELQNEWKEIGSVPQTHVKDLWETYHLHVENFYSFIKINNELRDLDLKKNYEAKIKLCEEAEALLMESSPVTAFHKLQKLHEQWREIGPVAREYKEQLWDRFKEASSKINKRHQEYFESQKEEQNRNLELKTELCVKAEELAASDITDKKGWDKASEELIEIQKIWKTIGFAPKKDNTLIYERFRKACDSFFEKKREFYNGLKEDMDANLQAKTDICLQAEALQDSTDWKKTTDELIELQKKWKEIGIVPRKYSDSIWKRFRKACDTFFERKAAHFSGIDSQYEENLAKKIALLEEIKAFEVTDRDAGFEMLKDFQRRWTEIGFVPIKEKDKLQNEYRKIIDEHFAKIKGGDRDRKIERFKDKISSLKSDRKGGAIRNERDRLYNRVKQLESDIALLENNIGFFAKSKNAEAVIRDVNEKIAKAREEMAVAIDKIKMIDNQATEEQE